MCLWNVETIEDQSNKVVGVMSRCEGVICGLQEVRSKVASARLLKGKDSKYEVFWVRNY